MPPVARTANAIRNGELGLSKQGYKIKLVHILKVVCDVSNSCSFC